MKLAARVKWSEPLAASHSPLSASGFARDTSDRVIACLSMPAFNLSALLEFIGHDLSPVRAVIVFFVIGYVIVGLPVHFRQGAASRDIWGTAAGVTMAALYAAFIVGVYPALHHAAAIPR
ncbi:hypothetical protein [Paraburkholderia sp. Ac-20342]|uniref:hypothetical protein n=1 Tax=Paraburkholderia sp. Ac-20342 TaxID=2703889 RepID=UPI001F120EF7|nr:hypothetical protein [Paraburkholderia sp. Ac-20342]